VLDVDVALASKRQVAEHLVSSAPRLNGRANPLVWVQASPGQVIELPAYGGGKVQSRSRFKRWVAAALMALAIALGIGMAVTPTAKLRLQAIEANHAYHKMTTQTASLAQKRGDLLLLTEKINAIKTVAQDAVDAPRLMNHLTNLLPDDTYLVSLTVQGRKVSLYGQTPNAAAFMQMLSNQKGFVDVKAPIAAIRPSGGTRDTFTIEFGLAPGLFAALQSAPSPVNGASGASAALAGASAPASTASSAPGPANSTSTSTSPSSTPSSTLSGAASTPNTGASAPAATASAAKSTLGPMNPGPAGAVTGQPATGGATFGGASFGGSSSQPAGKKP
jgi:general secretion pathway protein L